MYLYPLQCGRFIYEPDYYIHRECFDSILLMYIEKGTLYLEVENNTYTANEGEFVLLNCYNPHSYYTKENTTCLWCHFDGITARRYYNEITSHLGNTFYIPEAMSVLQKLQNIYSLFRDGKAIREPLISKYLTDILTLFLLSSTTDECSNSKGLLIEESMSYIREHFYEDIPLDKLAADAGLSMYHFLRIFKKESGYTPHQYIINTRMSHAKYLLTNTDMSVKEICFRTGFSSESVFCNAFKKHQNLTPSQYQALMHK